MSEFVNTASRRSLLIAGAATATFLAALPATRLVARPISTPSLETSKGNNMSYLTMKDGTQIFYKDWGTGQPVVFHHGWPLSGDDWDNQMLFFLEGYRVIAHDRRGHGRSTQTDKGNDMDTYAADMAELAAALDLKMRDPCWSFDRRRRGDPICCPPWQGTGGQGGADKRSPAGHGKDAQQIRAALPMEVVRRVSRGTRSQPRAVLPRCRERSLSTASTGRARMSRRA